MKAVLLDKRGPPSSLQVTDVDQPEPSDDEVLIKIKYSAVNYADLLSRQGLYSWAPEKPYIMGLEAAGEVVDKGKNINGISIGERILYASNHGGYAEYTTVHKDYLVQPPSHFTWEEVASFGATWFTSWVALHEMARVRPKEILLVQAAAGGVGTAAVQLGLAYGLDVYGTSSQEHKRRHVEELGATAFTYDNFDTKLYEMNKRPNVVIETVGGDVYRRSFRLLSPMGKIILIGVSGLKLNRYNPWSLYKAWKHLPRTRISQVLRRSRGFMGLHAGYLMSDHERMRPIYQNLVNFVEEQELRPVVLKDHIFPMSHAGEAHQFIHDRKNIGKVLLDPTK